MLKVGYTTIVNAKFIRKKEHDDVVFASMPRDYTLNVRHSIPDDTTKQFKVVEELEINIWQFNRYCREFIKNLDNLPNEVPDDELPF